MRMRACRRSNPCRYGNDRQAARQAARAFHGLLTSAKFEIIEQYAAVFKERLQEGSG